MSGKTETRLAWGGDTITITGRNAGVEAITVHFDNESLNIIDFLNTNLNAEFAALYEELMSRYEAKLNGANLFDKGFPETAFVPQKLTAYQKAAVPKDDEALINVLMKEYNSCLDGVKAHFVEYEKTVEKWFEQLEKK